MEKPGITRTIPEFRTANVECRMTEPNERRGQSGTAPKVFGAQSKTLARGWPSLSRIVMCDNFHGMSLAESFSNL